jgi:hypothetical protein
MVMGSNNLFWIFAGQYETTTIYLHCLVNDVRVGEDDKEGPESERNCCLKKIGHHGCCFATSHGTLARPEEFRGRSGATTRIDILSDGIAWPGAVTESFHICVKRGQPILPTWDG